MLREAGKDGRVVDYTGLENRHTATCRGFESLSFRRCFTSSLLWHIAISRTLEARRKEAGFLRIKLYKTRRYLALLRDESFCPEGWCFKGLARIIVDDPPKLSEQYFCE